MQTIERHVVAAGREQDTRAWRASSRPTLADDPALAAVAAVLDDAGALAADLGRADYTQPEELAAYDAVGIGESMVDGRPVLTIAHHFPEADAAAQVERLQALWEAVEPLGQMSPMMLEITDSGSHGDVAWLTARPGNPAAIELIKILLVAGEGPFTS